MKKTRIIFKVFCVLLIAAITIIIWTPVFMIKNENALKFEHAFYGENTETVDVGFFGGSFAYNAFCPNILWGEQKIRSYNYASSGQPLFLTYYVMNEVFKKQKIQTAVVDLYYIGLEADWFSSNYYSRTILDNMKMSADWIDAVNTCVEPKNRKYHYLTRYVPFYKYHYRWSEITEKDFFPKNDVYDYNPYLLGWGGEFDEYGERFATLTEDSRKADIPEKSLLYLEKIIELARQNNVRLIFTVLPHEYSSSGVDPQWVEDEYAVYNSVQEIADRNEISFIRFNNILNEIGFDERVDMYNWGHVSVYGAFKISSYLGSFIVDNNYLKKTSENDSDFYYEKYYNDFEEKFENYFVFHGVVGG